jgi:hypothetical protein
MIHLLIYYYIKKNFTFYIIEKNSFPANVGEGQYATGYLLITPCNETHTCNLYNILLERTIAKLKCYGIYGLRLYATDLVNSDKYLSDNQDKCLPSNN